uniref:Stereocilin-like n=1 Tax=Astyanax mexicanus TaxID=7994 RepID=A0A8B9KWZ5_ASTMX
SLGLLPKKPTGLPSLRKPLDRNRLSGFLYNISIPSFGQWDGRIPPRPSFKLQDLFLSLRGSPHWDGLLGLVQSILTFMERQPQKPILKFVSQNWNTISALLDTVLQALVSGTYGQASAGLQGFICVLKGRNDCAFNLSWLQQLLAFLETRNWKPVVNLHPAGALLRSNAAERALQFAEHNPALLQGLDGLRRGLLHRVAHLYKAPLCNLLRLSVICTHALMNSFITVSTFFFPPKGDLRQLILWGIRHNLTWNAQAMGFTSQGMPSRPTFMSYTTDLSASAEILEAACNASIPGLTGVSNFTVFLYCNLFEGDEATLDPEISQTMPDLHASCTNAAWYLTAAEEDFLWVHVCSEFFAQEFNNTVCANSSFWLQRTRELIRRLERPGDCLEMLSTRSLSAHDFRRCFLPNNSALILALCGNGSSSLPLDGWAAEYCSKVLPKDSQHVSKDKLCNFSNWTANHFLNSTLLELCGDTAGLRDHICKNMSRYLMLVRRQPLLLDYCNPNSKQGTKCVLQQLFDMLPAPYDFDTSQLCVNPVPILQEALHKLSLCEGVMDERVGWLATVSYVLRVLDFVVGLSAGLEEGEREVRQGLGQAILLSSLLDNASFWATLRPDASVSVLRTVGVFLRRERNPSVKEDLLSCFSPVLWDLIQKEDNSSALRFLLQVEESNHCFIVINEVPVSLIWCLPKSSPKEQEAMETMTAAFIHKFPRVTPELFVDLSQFIPYMSVSDIMSFPASLMVNDSVLMAISDHSSEMKSPQKQAFAKRLLQSSVVGDVPTWPPYFLTSILPLLPHLPVSHFQQLTSQQVDNKYLSASMDRLGPLLLFLDRDALAKVDREALKLRLEELKQYCMPSDSFREIASLLTERSMLGEPKSWTVGDVEHVGRLVFILSPQQIRSLPLDDLGKDTVEQVLQSQWRWQDSTLGKVCADLKGLKDKIYNGRGEVRLVYEPTPNCADVKGTFPSAWRWYQLSRMKRRELEECVEFMGLDASLDSDQRGALWAEPVKGLRPEHLMELGVIVTEMGERELQSANLSDLAVVAQLGSLTEWSSKKVRFGTIGCSLQSIMRRRKQKPEELGVVELVSLDHLLCGFTPSEIARLDPSNLSVAALFLRETVLPCSEDQTEALTARLSNTMGFGPVSSWGSEVFTEIGTLAAGLDDMVLTALVEEQIGGLTPAAIALIPPRKMTVVFSATQLSWLSAEQAWAVTEEQWEELDSEQRQALTVAQYEGDVMLAHRGGSDLI